MFSKNTTDNKHQATISACQKNSFFKVAAEASNTKEAEE